MSKIKDLSGKRFGRLTVVKFLLINKLSKAVFECVCDCGNIANVVGGNLTSGCTKSCGCILVEIYNNKAKDTFKRKAENNIVDKSGYASVIVSGRKTRVHRAIMAAELNRKILSSEVVHHKDGDKSNNNIDNLVIMSNRQHARLHYSFSQFSKLDGSKVKRIVQFYDTGSDVSEISERFCTNTRIVERIISGETWASVTGIGV